MSYLIGKSLGRYHILEQLGEGGMATVYKAYDTRLETDVAVKVIRTENILPSVLERTLKRFEREAKSLARLTHPNIVKVTDYGEFEGKPYLVMPYLPGGTLKERIKQGPIPWQEAVRLILPIAQALEYAHEQNIIHRDVKPSNILLTSKVQPMLTDFGVAKIFDLEVTSDLTGTGMGVGTPEYMAPEQWQGQVSAQTDVYALGVVLYEMVTGRRPYTADTPAAILLKQATEPLPRPSQYAHDLPVQGERLLLKALARSLEDRYQGMGALAAALEALPMNVSSTGRETPRENIPAQPPRARSPQPSLERAAEKPMRETSTAAFVPERTSFPSVWPMGLVFLLMGAVVVSILIISNQTGPATPTLSPLTESPIAIPPTEPTVAMTGAPTEAQALSDEITDPKGVPMRLVPAGEFTMGGSADIALEECQKFSLIGICDRDWFTDEEPIHTVFLDAFYMDKYEVTNALYAACVKAGVCVPPQDYGSDTRSSYYGNAQYDEYPVIYMDWEMANIYCEWRGARLPTEAEWEKAARGTDGRAYPWGEGIDCKKANYSLCVGDTSAVGSYESGKSPYGIYDLAGNAWEWVADWYAKTYYQISPSGNPLGPSSGQDRVLRGGSWFNYGNVLRSSRRGRYSLDILNGVSFRCARSLP